MLDLYPRQYLLIVQPVQSPVGACFPAERVAKRALFPTDETVSGSDRVRRFRLYAGKMRTPARAWRTAAERCSQFALRDPQTAPTLGSIVIRDPRCDIR